MPIMFLRTKVKPESADAAEAAVRDLFAALAEAEPEGVRYTSYKSADGVTYVVLLEIADGVENPLPQVPAFQEFQKNLGGWLAEPPVPDQLTLAGHYEG